jgi:hypothetical protein
MLSTMDSFLHQEMVAEAARRRIVELMQPVRLTRHGLPSFSFPFDGGDRRSSAEQYGYVPAVISHCGCGAIDTPLVAT